MWLKQNGKTESPLLLVLMLSVCLRWLGLSTRSSLPQSRPPSPTHANTHRQRVFKRVWLLFHRVLFGCDWFLILSFISGFLFYSSYSHDTLRLQLPPFLLGTHSSMDTTNPVLPKVLSWRLGSNRPCWEMVEPLAGGPSWSHRPRRVWPWKDVWGPRSFLFPLCFLVVRWVALLLHLSSLSCSAPLKA